MKFIFFMDCIEHITRLARILRVERGNALLLGVGGMGKQSLTRLVSHLCNYRWVRWLCVCHSSVDLQMECVTDATSTVMWSMTVVMVMVYCILGGHHCIFVRMVVGTAVVAAVVTWRINFTLSSLLVMLHIYWKHTKQYVHVWVLCPGVLNLNLNILMITIHFLMMCEDCILLLVWKMKLQPSFSVTLRSCMRNSLETSVISWIQVNVSNT